MKISKVVDLCQLLSAIIVSSLFLFSKEDHILYSIMLFVFGLSTLYKIIIKKKNKLK